MSAPSIEDRVAALESQMAQLLLRRKSDEPKKDWRQAIGRFTGDEIMWEIDQLALAYREEDRRRSLAEFDAQQGESK
jgi:hypothetical protein